MTPRKPRILIADFFGTVKERGIPAYVRDLEAIGGMMGDVHVLRAPKWVRRQPQAVQNLLMVLHEQLVVPLHALRLRPALILFPYNTSSYILSLFPQTVCVVHDLIPYKREHGGFSTSFLYVACTKRWHALLGRRFAAVSPYTRRTLEAIARFKRSPVTYIPNCFSGLAPARDLPIHAPRLRRVTLISGVGPNKQFARAIELIASVGGDPRFEGVAFDIVGFGDEHDRATRAIAQYRARACALPLIEVHPMLSRAKLDTMLRDNSVTWAHSAAEGFGRVVVEGRMAGRPVVMSGLPVFRALRDPWTFAYRNGDDSDFRDKLHLALENAVDVGTYQLVETLRADAASGMAALLRR